MSITVNPFFDERRAKKKSKYLIKQQVKLDPKEEIYPVKLTVYHPVLGKKRFVTDIDLTPSLWAKINSPNLKDPFLKETKLELDAKVLIANEIIKELKPFSFKEFELEFYGDKKKQKKDSFFEIFQSYVDKLKSSGLKDLATKYETTLQILKKFRATLSILQVTPNFLTELESYIKDEHDPSVLVVRAHMRNINSVIIDLIANEKLQQDKCPFNLLFELFECYKEDLKAQDRVGTASLFRYTCNSLKEMRSDLKLMHVTKELLDEYQNYMRAKNVSDTSIGINLRNIRAIINVAIKKGLFPQDKYPFKGYVIPSSQNVKKALEDKALNKVLKYTTNDPDKLMAWDFWVFLYLGNGMNMKDAVLLLKQNVDKDFLYFVRAKTIRTRKKDLRPIKVPLHPVSKKIVKRRRSDDSNPYLFPILEPGLSAVTVRGRINRLLKFVNKHIKEIFKELKIDLGLGRKPGTMDARHSYATKLRRKGVPDNEIGEYLGHTDPKTTKNYFASFPDEHLKKRSKLLL